MQLAEPCCGWPFAKKVLWWCFQDAQSMSENLADIISHWHSERPSNIDHVLDHYVNHRDWLDTTIAQKIDMIIGFHSLKLANPDIVCEVPPSSGFIGTYMRPGLARTGVECLLFEDTLTAAKAAKLPLIDATITQDNPNGLAYNSSMGFVDYHERRKAISNMLVFPAGCPENYRGERFAKILCKVLRCILSRLAVSLTLRSHSS